MMQNMRADRGLRTWLGNWELPCWDEGLSITHSGENGMSTHREGGKVQLVLGVGRYIGSHSLRLRRYYGGFGVQLVGCKRHGYVSSDVGLFFNSGKLALSVCSNKWALLICPGGFRRAGACYCPSTKGVIHFTVSRPSLPIAYCRLWAIPS